MVCYYESIAVNSMELKSIYIGKWIYGYVDIVSRNGTNEI